ncbi:hypothetical protein M758_10G127900 [Ceratodon purpureus]|nr:hypothetical protein M758_10G127900 [Ceratodon purpureus]
MRHSSSALKRLSILMLCSSINVQSNGCEGAKLVAMNKQLSPEVGINNHLRIYNSRRIT